MTTLIDTGTGTKTGAAGELTSPPPPPFYDGFQDAGLKDAASKSGFKSGEEAFAYANKFAAFKDADPALLARLPKSDDFNAMVAFNQERFGAPKEAAAYGLDKIENVDKDLAGAASTWFAEAGITPAQAQFLAQKQMEWQNAQITAQAKEQEIISQREVAALKAELGSEYAARMELSGRALKAAGKAAGLEKTEVDALIRDVETMIGTGKALKLFSYFGKFVKESDFVDGAPQGGDPMSTMQKWYPKEYAKQTGG